MAQLIHDFITQAAQRTPDAAALSYQGLSLPYGELAQQVRTAAGAWLALGLGRGERLAVFLEKREETVVAMFGAAMAGAVFVPVNPLLKPDQLAYILADCNVRILVTSPERLAAAGAALAGCAELRRIVLVDADGSLAPTGMPMKLSWQDAMRLQWPARLPRNIDSDVAAILYTSGSTGKPKGVVLSHRNLVAGAASVASYLGNRPDDRLLCVLPLSFDYGLSQVTTAFASGACAVLMNYLLLRDIVQAVAEQGITGLAGVPPLWIQLSQIYWPETGQLRYITNSGGALQPHTVAALRRALPRTSVFLMYGLTEAFRSTYLAPDQLDRRPDSIGKAIPNVEVLVLRADGSVCGPGEEGELVHRGPLVAQGYWNDPVRTAERFRPLPRREAGLPLPELAVWSGDIVRSDEEGYLYFVGRNDEMIKSSGYRISPAEVEEVVYATGLVGEAVALGVPHAVLGQVVAVLATAAPGVSLDSATLLAACRSALPNYMVPAMVELRSQPLPRNPNGKIDRKLLAAELAQRHGEAG